MSAGRNRLVLSHLFIEVFLHPAAAPTGLVLHRFPSVRPRETCTRSYQTERVARPVPVVAQMSFQAGGNTQHSQMKTMLTANCQHFSTD
jgi:hypothetical protein